MRLRFALLGASLVVAPLWVHGEASPLPLPEIKTSVFLEGMPSFSQRSSEFDGGGKNFCGPTAASNALMWLADRGYPNLKPISDDDRRAQKEMIKRLAAYMGTCHQGTSVEGFRSGVNAYLRTAGYSSRGWVYSGNSCSAKAQTPPDLQLARTLSSGKTVMWFSLGWYSFDESSKKYSRDYGHLVTVVGFGKTCEGYEDQECFVIADPESPNAHRYITLKMLNEGKISNGSSKVDAKGYYNIVGLDNESLADDREYCILESLQALTVN